MLGVQRKLNDEQRLIIESVRGLMKKFDEGYWSRLDREKSYPEDFYGELEKQGMTAVSIPVEYGGAGYGLREACLIVEEINAMGGNAQPLHGQFYLSFVLSKFGSDQLKERYLPKLAKGELRIQTLALTEPDSGSDTTRIGTFAERKDGAYLVRGHKLFISRIEQSDLMVLVARTTPYDTVKKKTDGISLFLVDLRSAKGITWRKIETMFNSQTYELFIDGLEVPEENIIGSEGKGFYHLLDVLNPERILLASECIGDARWFIDKAVNYAKNRVVFGRPIGQNQGVQFPLAEAYANLVAAAELRWAAAELFDTNAESKLVGEYANIAKYIAAECSWKAANVAMDVYGGMGLAVNAHVERKFRENRLYRVAPVSQNLALAYISHHVLELPRSY